MANALVGFFKGLWRVLDSLRRVLHLGLLLMLFFFTMGIIALSSDVTVVPGSAALQLTPRGNLVDQLTGDPFSRAVDRLSGDGVPQALLRDVLLAIKTAKDDKRIKVLVLDLSGMGSAGLSKLQAVGRAMDDFKTSGKKVIAVSDFYSQGQYYVASRADEIYMHPMGVVYIDGFGRYRTYYKEAIDKLLIDWNVFTVGEFKSFPEPYIRNDMSPEDRESTRLWLDSLWAAYMTDVTAARELDETAITDYVESFVPDLRASGGDMAQLAVDAGLVDALMTREQVRTRIKELTGEDDDADTYTSIGYAEYVTAVRDQRGLLGASDETVGVIVAAGDILPGEQPPGTIGAESLVKLIRSARNDDSVKAVVLRVDSGGGSTFASEIIADELRELQAEGKPLVVSMSSVAASGGYWIAMPADEIWANPTTITGSIGVLAMLPTFQRSMDWLGVHVDGIGTTTLSGQFRPDRGLGAEAREILQLSIEDAYRQFITGVADARGKTVEEIDPIAQGRVWTGADAHRLGLVDELGDLDSAVESAAALAALGDDYDVRYMEKELSFGESFMLGLASKTETVLGKSPSDAQKPSAWLAALLDVRIELERLARFNDPMNRYYFCFCAVSP